MQHRPLGNNTDLQVSPICLGTMLFGAPVGRSHAIRLVNWALDNGINFFDVANIYEGYDRTLGSAGGVAEEFLGEALRARRTEAVITTKVGSSVGSGPDDQGLGRLHILKQVDSSLRRLQTDCIDVYELHRPDPHTPLEQTLQVMMELIRAGKVRYWGISNFGADDIRRVITLCVENNWQTPSVSQPPYSWLNRDVEREHLAVCIRNAIAVTPYRPLESGLLTGKYRRGQAAPSESRASEKPEWLPEFDAALFDRLEQFAAEAKSSGLTPAAYSIRWLLDRPGICSVVVGAKRIEQLEQLLPAVN